MSQYRNRRQASSGSPQNSRNNARLQAQRRRRRRKKRQLRILYTLCILILVAIAGLVFWKTRDGSSKNIPENPADLQSENNGSDIQKATPSPYPDTCACDFVHHRRRFIQPLRCLNPKKYR